MAELVGVRLGLPLLRILIAELRVSYVDAFGISASVYTEGELRGCTTYVGWGFLAAGPRLCILMTELRGVLGR